MKKIALLLILLLTQSCAQIEYHAFLSEEKDKLIEKCLKSGKNSVTCEIEATNTINDFRNKIENN